MARFVGKSKAQSAVESEGARIESAMASVQSRLEGLDDRVKVARQRALVAQKAGKREEAMREMKKLKAAQKQQATVQMALEALERQADALAQTSLQKELATALASTNKQMKAKSKGLLSFAEKTIDESVEVADEVEDVAQVFEGLVPAGSGAFDDDELKEELEAMVEEEDGSASESSSVQASVVEPAKALEESNEWGSFPSAPVSNKTSKKSKKEDQQALLSAVD